LQGLCQEGVEFKISVYYYIATSKQAFTYKEPPGIKPDKVTCVKNSWIQKEEENKTPLYKKKKKIRVCDL